MSRLAENNLRYQTDIEVLLRKFSMLKQGIIEGGR
jgi:flagellar basal body rod protein FlgB